MRCLYFQLPSIVLLALPYDCKTLWHYDGLKFLHPSSSHDWKDAGIDIYPNPAREVLNITINNFDSKDELLLTIISIDGKQIAEYPLKSQTHTIDISSLASGVYTVKVAQNQQPIFVTKFVKIR